MDVIEEKVNPLSKIDSKKFPVIPEKKKKKEKQITRSIFLIGKKRKQKKLPSEIAKWTNELIKLGYKTPEEIQGYFDTKRVKITNQNKSLYQMLIGSRVLNGNMRLSDVLTNKPVYMYYYRSRLVTRCMTNDFLFLECLLKRLLTQDETNNLKVDLYKLGVVSKVYVCSLPFICNGQVKKGYYQDYSENFAAIGVENLNERDRNDLFSGKNVNQFSFFFDGIKFSSYGTSNACVIFESNKGLDAARKMYDDMKIINASGKLSLEEKVVDIDNKARYIDCKIFPESFCPAFLLTPENIDYSVLFYIKMNYNDLFNFIEKSGNKVELPSNLFYWDTMQQAFDFLGVFSITSQRINDDNKKKIYGTYIQYEELKDVLMVWRKNQLFYQKILLDFYHSFNTRINFDKLMDLYSKITDYIEQRNILTNDESYNEVKEFINVCTPFSQMVAQQLTEKVFSIADKMKDVLGRLNSGASLNIVENLREIGLAIYYTSARFGDDKCTPAFPFIVSPGGFLGNVLGKIKIEEDVLQNMVNDLNKQRQNIERKVENQNENVINIISQLENLQNKVIENTIKIYAGREIENINQETMNYLVNEIRNGINNNPEIKNNFNARVIEAYQGDAINTFTVDSEYIKNAVNNYLLSLQNERLQKMNQINQLNQNINTMRNQINNIKNDEKMDEESVFSTKSEVSEITANYISNSKKDRNLLIDNLTNWYADILGGSMKYQGVSPTTVHQVMSGNLLDDMNKYSIDLQDINIIAADYGLPSYEQIISWGKPYQRRVTKWNGKKYADEVYMKGRKEELANKPSGYQNRPTKRKIFNVQKIDK